MAERPSKQVVKEGLAGLASRSRNKRGGGGGGGGGAHALDLATTLQRYGYSTGFETAKHIEEYYSHHPISSAVEQREELRARRDFVSEALKAYVTNHYQSFISTSSEITTIEADMLKLNNLLGQFQLTLKVLAGAISFAYEDGQLGAKMKAIEKANSNGGGTDLLGASSSSGASGGQHPAEVELEELLEELRSWIYERKFEKALATLELATEKARRRARELSKQQQQQATEDGSGGGGFLGIGGNGNDASHGGSGGAPTAFRAIAGDLLDLRATLIEMLFSELRAAATASSGVIGGGGGKSGGSATSSRGGGGGKRSSLSPSSSSSMQGQASAHVQLQSLVSHLIHLRQTKKTLQIFLYQVKSAHLRAAIKSIKFTGDILGYIADLSAKFFAGLGATVGEFQRLFIQGGAIEGEERGGGGESSSSGGGGKSDSSKFVSNPAGLSSYLMRWVLHELLTTYNAIFQRQVFQSEGTFSKLGKCLRHAFHHCQILEKERNGPGTGLSLSFVLSKLFIPSLTDVISKNYKHVEQLIHEELGVEAWRVTELWVQEKGGAGTGTTAGAATTTGGAAQQLVDKRSKRDSTSGGTASASSSSASSGPRKKQALRLTSSAKYLYDVVRNLLRELVPILDHHTSHAETRTDLYPTVVSGMVGLFESYLLAMAQKLKNGLWELDELQALSMVANSYYLHADLLPRVIKEFKKQFCAPSSSSSSSSSTMTMSGGPASTTPASTSSFNITTTTTSSSTIPELELFGVKLARLYEALRDSFATKRAHLLWPFEGHLRLTTKLLAGQNKYANPMALVTSGDLVQVTPEWLEFAENYLPAGFRANVVRTLPAHEVDVVVGRSMNEFLDALLEGQFKNREATGQSGAATTGNATTTATGGIDPTTTSTSSIISTALSTSTSIWPGYIFGLGGLQQFVLDLRYFAVSIGGEFSPASSTAASSLAGSGASSSTASAVGVDSASTTTSAARIIQMDKILPGGYLSERGASSLSALLSLALESYCSKTATKPTREWMDSTLKWIDPAVEKRARNPKVMGLGKSWRMEREKERLELQRDREAASARSAQDDLEDTRTRRHLKASSAAAAASSGSGSHDGTMTSMHHGSSAIHAPLSGVRRGSTITPEQLALMNEATPISEMDDGEPLAAGGKRPTTARSNRRQQQERDELP